MQRSLVGSEMCIRDSPGPMNRGVEIDGELADDINRSVIQEQVEMGVAIRMAAMHLLARNDKSGKHG